MENQDQKPQSSELGDVFNRMYNELPPARQFALTDLSFSDDPAAQLRINNLLQQFGSESGGSGI